MRLLPTSRTRRIVLACELAGLAAVALGYYLSEHSLGLLEWRYRRIRAGMTADEVYAVMWSRPDCWADACLYRSSGEAEPERAVADAWKKEWGRPCYVLVGYDAHGGVSWKLLGNGSFKKLNRWLIGTEKECFADPPPVRIEVVGELPTPEAPPRPEKW